MPSNMSSMSQEVKLRAMEVLEDVVCRICLQNAKFELSESSFDYDDKELTLLAAFNELSIIEHVRSCVLRIEFEQFLISSLLLSECGRLLVREMLRFAHLVVRVHQKRQGLR